MNKLIKESFNGSANITKTFVGEHMGFYIKNDGASALTFTIGTTTIPVDAEETFEDVFAPFNEVVITTTVPYRAHVFTPITSAGGSGATNLNELSDVDTTIVAPVDGYVLAYNNTTGQWEPREISAVGAPPAIDGGSFTDGTVGNTYDGGTF